MNLRAAWFLVLCTFLGACGTASDPAGWLDRAAEAHERADRAIGSNDLDTARAALLEVLHPSSSLAIDDEDLRIVRQDLYFRLAGLELAEAAPEKALHWANEGLTLGAREDIFTANLLVVRGQANQALGNDHGAAQDFFEAQRINQVLLRSVLEAEETEEQP